MFVTLVRLIGVVQITFPKYCMSNSALITDNKANFNACLLPKKLVQYLPFQHGEVIWSNNVHIFSGLVIL